MRVFVTGASGFVGSAVVPELIRAGHSVAGLARSDASAAAIAATGAEVRRGSLDDPDSLRAGAEAADGVIHTAFIHDFSKFAENCEVDRRAVAALASALEGTAKPLIVTSGTGLLPQGRLVTEADGVASATIPRVASEQAADAAAGRGVHAMVMRLPPSVHGDGDRGFVPLLVGMARDKGVSAYVGDGENRWSAVHRLDAAKAYRLALEKGEAGARYHAAAEGDVRFRAIAEIIGRRLGVPVVAKTPQEAAAHFGWFAHFAAMDNRASSERTRATLSWQPTERGLIADLDGPAYFGG